METLMSNEYFFLLVGVFILFWLFWLPRALAPVLVKRYDGLPPWLKATIALALPTLEQAVLNAWDNVYHEIEIITDATPTTLDNDIWEEVDRRVRSILAEGNKPYVEKDIDPIYTSPSDFRLNNQS